MYGASENLILILITDPKVTALDRLIEALVESNPDILKSSGNRVSSNDYTEDIDTNPPDDQVSEDKDDQVELRRNTSMDSEPFSDVDRSIDYQNVSIDTSSTPCLDIHLLIFPTRSLVKYNLSNFCCTHVYILK